MIKSPRWESPQIRVNIDDAVEKEHFGRAAYYLLAFREDHSTTGRSYRSRDGSLSTKLGGGCRSIRALGGCDYSCTVQCSFRKLHDPRAPLCLNTVASATARNEAPLDALQCLRVFNHNKL